MSPSRLRRDPRLVAASGYCLLLEPRRRPASYFYYRGGRRPAEDSAKGNGKGTSGPQPRPAVPILAPPCEPRYRGLFTGLGTVPPLARYGPSRVDGHLLRVLFGGVRQSRAAPRRDDPRPFRSSSRRRTASLRKIALRDRQIDLEAPDLFGRTRAKPQPTRGAVARRSHVNANQGAVDTALAEPPIRA